MGEGCRRRRGAARAQGAGQGDPGGVAVTTMEGQRVVIVGGTSGIGLATVRATAALGAEVVAAGRRPLAQRESIPGVQAADVDITAHESVQRLFPTWGGIGHLLVTCS